jgi:hypothetical protein
MVLFMINRKITKYIINYRRVYTPGVDRFQFYFQIRSTSFQFSGFIFKIESFIFKSQLPASF